MPTPVAIDRLWQGSSGQAPWQRRSGTVESSTNCRFDLRVGGAVKRNATSLIADLISYTDESFDPTAGYHWLAIRDSIIAIGAGGDVHAWDGDGDALDVIDDTSGGFANYMTSASDPDYDIDVSVSFDTAIVVNKREPTGWLDGPTYQQSLNIIANNDPTESFGVTGLAVVNAEVVATFDDIVESSLTTGAVYEVTASQSGNPASLYIYFDETELSLLDGPHPDSPIVEHAAGLYRIAIPGQQKARYDPTKMPYRIVYNESLRTMTIKEGRWKHRISGNETSNALMPWAEREEPIPSCAFLSGRLYLAGSDYITGSRKGDFWNFFVSNIEASADDELIAVDITQSEFGKVLRITAVGGGLFIAAEKGQLEFSAGSQTPTSLTARTIGLTTFGSLDLKPVSSGSFVAMIDDLGDVHQFIWSGDSEQGLVYNGLLSAHQWDVLDNKTPVKMNSWGTTVAIIVEGEPALIHDSFFVEGRMEQSAWGNFTSYDPAVFFDQWGSVVRVITKDQSSAGGYSLLHYVHREVPPPDGMLYQPHLDRMELVPASRMTYDSLTDRTTIPHTGKAGDVNRSFLVTKLPEAHAFYRPVEIDDNGDPVFAGDHTGQSLEYEQYLGFGYHTELELTKLYPGLSGQNIVTSRLVTFHLDSSDYKVRALRADGSELGDSDWQAHRVGVSILDQPIVETGFKDHGFQGDPRKLTLILESDTPGHVAWLGLEYDLTGQGRGKG